MTRPSIDVAVVTVTYGQRGRFVQALLTGLAAATVRPAACLIVDNGSVEDLEAVCLETRGAMAVEILHQDGNAGSAAGFAAGMRRACELGYERIWLLDDDNEPEPDALERLLEQLAREDAGAERVCLASLRLDRGKYLKAAAGHPSMAFSAPNTFMGFSLVSRLARTLQPAPARAEHASQEVRLIDVAIYGGLILPAAAVDTVGLPDERYFLYLDDREYTTRLTLAGFLIKLVPAARIKDLEDSWATPNGPKLPWAFNPNASAAKVYYMIRNGVHYDRNFVVRSSAAYLFNALTYLVASGSVALARGVGPATLWKRMSLVRRAFLDGWRGRLGKATFLH